ncbi:MAG: nucleotide exchange factor GrpE [Ignavibacteria bacterium]|nr:nucleotide exchange factor GrpE [Ignavibacteria bacterium]
MKETEVTKENSISDESEKIINEEESNSQIDVENKENKSTDSDIEQTSKIQELETKINELKDALLRKAAEFENYKRRTENDQFNLLKYAAEPFIINILTVYDDLERSLEHIDEENSFDSLKKGLQLVYDNFTKILENQGVKKFEAKGKPFNVEFHEALMQRQDDNVEPHTVLEVIEHGYSYKDKIIRHAKVIVSAETINGNQDSKPSQENNEG